MQQLSRPLSLCHRWLPPHCLPWGWGQGNGGLRSSWSRPTERLPGSRPRRSATSKCTNSGRQLASVESQTYHQRTTISRRTLLRLMKILLLAYLLNVRSLTHSNRVFSDILTTPVKMDIVEKSTGEKISIFSLNIFWMLDARLVSLTPDGADQPPADRLL